jgi:hypothetical protein
MLPERAFREFYINEPWRGLIATTTTRFWLLFALSKFRAKIENINPKPETLTGEAWIAAKDKQTEQALEAIY